MIDTQTKTEQAQGAETVNAIFADFRNQTETSYPSLYSREDVLLLIDQIQAKVSQVTPVQQSTMDSDVLDNLKSKLKERLESVIDSHDYDDNAEFELSGRSILLDFSSRYLNDEVMEGIDEVWDEIFQTKEDED